MSKFYVLEQDIENEIEHYSDQFKGKKLYLSVFVPPEKSNFWSYFHKHFSELGLKSLTATFFDPDKAMYKIEYTGGADGDNNQGTITAIESGDFRCRECNDILKASDIVITSLPTDSSVAYMDCIFRANKQFIVLCDKSAISYDEMFEYIKTNKMWLGYTNPTKFMKPDTLELVTQDNMAWFTNIDIPKRHEWIMLHKKYDKKIYPRYVSQDVINVDRADEIPANYMGTMSVPMSFLDIYSPDQFEITGRRKWNGGGAIKPVMRIFIKRRVFD